MYCENRYGKSRSLQKHHHKHHLPHDYSNLLPKFSSLKQTYKQPSNHRNPSTEATVISPSTTAMVIQIPPSLLSPITAVRSLSYHSSKQSTVLFLQLNIQPLTARSTVLLLFPRLQDI